MKKFIALLLALVMALSLVACGKTAEPATDGADDGAATEAEYVIKLAGSGIDNHADLLNKTFAQLVEERTEGRVTVDYYPALQLGSIREYHEACQAGQIQACEGGAVIFANFTDKWNFMNLPMMFDNREAVQYFLKSDVGQQLIMDIAEETNLLLLACSENGFQAITNNKREIHSPADMKGLKIRTQESPILLNAYEALGANPTPMAYSELFTALQQGTVDGQVNPAVVSATTNIWEVQKYVTDLNLIYDIISLSINYDYFKSLPEDIQEIIQQAADDALAVELDYCAADYLQVLEDNGMVVTRLTDEERAAFKEAVAPCFDWFKANYDEPNLDTYLAAIDEANAACK